MMTRRAFAKLAGLSSLAFGLDAIESATPAASAVADVLPGSVVVGKTVMVEEGALVDVMVAGDLRFHRDQGDAADRVTFDLYIDGVACGVAQVWRATNAGNGSYVRGPLYLNRLFSGLSAGPHKFELRCTQTDYAVNGAVSAPSIRIFQRGKGDTITLLRGQ